MYHAELHIYKQVLCTAASDMQRERACVKLQVPHHSHKKIQFCKVPYAKDILAPAKGVRFHLSAMFSG